VPLGSVGMFCPSTFGPRQAGSLLVNADQASLKLDLCNTSDTFARARQVSKLAGRVEPGVNECL
jgi:hypothetical protein